MNLLHKQLLILWLILNISPVACENEEEAPVDKSMVSQSVNITPELIEEIKKQIPRAVVVPHNIKVGSYFSFMDSMVSRADNMVDYRLTEYLLVHANPWIIDTLRSFDYYERKRRGEFVYDQRELLILRQGDTLWLPGKNKALALENRLKCTVIDVNIPEFKLRIMVNDTAIYTLPVRVGRHEIKYLKTAGREVDLRTPVGEGKVVRVERDPWFVNPVSGKHYTRTRRDDGLYTLMPPIPWLEPMINGVCQGALIHPTTNPMTLGKAYSNGCVGMAEGDAWIVYYYAPLGTKVRFRYDLEIPDEQGGFIHLEDIYSLEEKGEI